jgi:hypothetical protein
MWPRPETCLVRNRRDCQPKHFHLPVGIAARTRISALIGFFAIRCSMGLETAVRSSDYLVRWVTTPPPFAQSHYNETVHFPFAPLYSFPTLQRIPAIPPVGSHGSVRPLKEISIRALRVRIATVHRPNHGTCNVARRSTSASPSAPPRIPIPLRGLRLAPHCLIGRTTVGRILLVRNDLRQLIQL